MTTQEQVAIENAIPAASIFAHEETAHYPYRHTVIIIEVVTEDRIEFWGKIKVGHEKLFIENPWRYLVKGSFTNDVASKILN